MNYKNIYKNKVYKEIRRPKQDLINALKNFSVATLHEAMSGVNLMAPILRPLIRNSKVVGPAMTALCHDGDNLGVHRVLSLAKSGDVLVISSFSPNYGGMWGEMLSISAKARGVAGIIIDGGIRDAALIRDCEFPVWYRVISAQSTIKENIGGVNIPITCGSVIVYPGDVIVADEDGVLVIPIEDIPGVLSRAEERDKKELELKPRLETGELIYDLFGFFHKIKEKDVQEIDGIFPGRR
jgi:4-hydroxy-4-methyl-2-oxoglutarate aldolase